jgi:glycosyltransferase involved in cell wall biosynthesis
MRVLVLSHSSDLGGAEVALAEAAAGLARHGVEAHVGLPRPGPLAERLGAAASVWVTREPWPWWLAEDRRARTLPTLVRQSRAAVGHIRARIREIRPDLVLTNTSTFPQGAVAARLERVPHVWHVHEFGREDLGLRNVLGDGLGYRSMGALSSRVIACSHAVADKLTRNISAKKVRVVYGAVDVTEPAMAAPPPPPFRLLTLGRLHPRKGLEDAIRATAILFERGLDIELHVVGGGPRSPYRPALERPAARSGAGDRIRFHTHTPAPAAELAKCHILLMTSRAEAFGRVTIEAMKAGRPVVAARAAASLELVRNGSNGLLYQGGDAADLAAQITRLYEDQALRETIGERALDWAGERFTLERLGADLRRVLDEAVRSGS